MTVRKGVGRRVGASTAALALALSFALALTACGDDDDSPARTGNQPSAEVEGEFDDYIGLDVEAAGDLAEENDLPWRVVRQDGEDLAVSMDFVENRLNFEVEDGEVVQVTTG